MSDASTVSIPRLVVAAPHGRSGKTTATLALVGALAARGLAVQPFKKGPDYIDPSWLTAAAQRPARNLDPFMLDAETIKASVARRAGDAEIAIVEGNHGLFDSVDEDGKGSTAAVARMLQAPIVLVVDAARMGRSVAALVDGFQYFEPDTNLAGVILNNVAHARHAARLQAAVEEHCGIPVLGILPRDESLTIADRHLGLVPRGEYESQARAPLDAMRRAAEEFFNLDAIVEIANAAPPLGAPAPAVPAAEPTRRVGVVRDAAFTFYYPENLQALEDAGASLVFVDARHTRRLPALDALYIGGGFPEVFAEELQANASLRSDIRAAIENDLPVYAECGGLMYLARSLEWHERRWEMVGALPCDVEIMDTPQGHGYVQACVAAANPLFSVDTVLRGHEYHHSRVLNLDPETTLAYRLERGHGIAVSAGGNGAPADGIVHRRVLAAYTHLHALGTPQWAPALVNQRERCGA
ncbi:MAG: hydrogenobyrinic acid a,c-diamide synthase (glutamine-hydrolyzing) [Chloroflexi bacterium]|nr:hydrogenobyrinic acid a,c-diamide synthase (glutamine-hydrolyzing) [Chloroflexota bacterium]